MAISIPICPAIERNSMFVCLYTLHAKLLLLPIRHRHRHSHSHSSTTLKWKEIFQSQVYLTRSFSSYFQRLIFDDVYLIIYVTDTCFLLPSTPSRNTFPFRLGRADDDVSLPRISQPNRMFPIKSPNLSLIEISTQKQKLSNKRVSWVYHQSHSLSICRMHGNETERQRIFMLMFDSMSTIRFGREA